MRESAESLLAIIGDILDLSRIESGQAAVERNDFEIRSMLGTVVLPFEQDARQKGLELSVEVAEQVPEYHPRRP